MSSLPDLFGYRVGFPIGPNRFGLSPPARGFPFFFKPAGLLLEPAVVILRQCALRLLSCDAPRVYSPPLSHSGIWAKYRDPYAPSIVTRCAQSPLKVRL